MSSASQTRPAVSRASSSAKDSWSSNRAPSFDGSADEPESAARGELSWTSVVLDSGKRKAHPSPSRLERWGEWAAWPAGLTISLRDSEFAPDPTITLALL